MKRDLHGEAALVPALDLERHAPRALLIGLFLATLLHATAVAYGKLMPPEPQPRLFPVVVRPIEIDLTPAPPPVVILPYELGETTIEVPSPRPAQGRTTLTSVPIPTPTPTPTPTPPPPPTPPPTPRGPDRSSPARLGGNVSWKCPFPKEADPEMRHVVVRAQAEVRPDGSALSIAILDDPGYGFGREARLCAMQHTYVPARGHDGQPAQGFTVPFKY